jgi:hypothetical protein
MHGTPTKAIVCATALGFAAVYVLATLPAAPAPPKPIESKRAPRFVEQPIECMAPQSLAIDYVRAHCFMGAAR